MTPPPPAPAAGRRASRPWYAVVGLVLVAINLRPALAGVGPLVGDIRDATGLSNAALGLLTTLPLLAFGTISVLTPVLTHRLGIERSIGVAMLLTGLGILLRAGTPAWLLFGGTLLAGVGIALGNVLMPALVKQDFPERTGPMTSVYSSVMAVGATLAAGTSVPLASAIGWRGALAVWAIPAFVALAAWLPRLKGVARPSPTTGAALWPGALLRSPLAWQVALYMGLQSFTFYVVLAWLPALVQSRGLGATEAGWLLALSQATGIVGSAVFPTWAGRRTDHRIIVWTLAALEAVALAGLLLPVSAALTTIWVALLGVVLGGNFGLALLFLAARAPDVPTATALSGVAQSVGYLVAATGPTLVGFLRDVTGDWTVPLLSLVAVLLVKTLFGTGAGRPGMVHVDGASTA